MREARIKADAANARPRRMGALGALVAMQLKDKLDFGFVKSRKLLIRKAVFSLLKFAGVGAASYLIWWALSFFAFNKADTPHVLTAIMTLLIGISILTCTVGLVRSLYFSDDNRVLITLPVHGNLIFVSKMIVYYLYELAREYMLITPIVIGCGLVNISAFGIWFIPWTLIMMVIVPALPVLAGALLSIPALYIARFANRFSFVKMILFALVAAAVTAGIVILIGKLPDKIDFLTVEGNAMIGALRSFIRSFRRAVPPAYMLVVLLVGGATASGGYSVFTGETFAVLGGVIGVLAVAFALVFFLSRPLFFGMMSKSFEFEKRQNLVGSPNRAHGVWHTFLKKEFRLLVLNTEVSLPYIVTYIAVPVLIYLLNKLYSALVDLSNSGLVMTYAFNLLIMLLPMLASNAVISTIFSKEGRAGYIKKTKPVNIMLPIMAKLFYFMLFSLPSVIATVAVFGTFAEAFDLLDIILLFFIIILVQYAHILFSALLDMMNPQNEQYATVGDSVQNPNETKSTVAAFVASLLFALFSFILFGENYDVTIALVKLLLPAAALFGVSAYVFVRSVKCYYYEK